MQRRDFLRTGLSLSAVLAAGFGRNAAAQAAQPELARGGMDNDKLASDILRDEALGAIGADNGDRRNFAIAGEAEARDLAVVKNAVGLKIGCSLR